MGISRDKDGNLVVKKEGEENNADDGEHPEYKNEKPEWKQLLIDAKVKGIKVVVGEVFIEGDLVTDKDLAKYIIAEDKRRKDEQ